MVITTASRADHSATGHISSKESCCWQEDLAGIDSERRQFRTEIQLCHRGFIRPRAEHPGRRSALTRGTKEFHLQTLPPRLLPPERLVRRPVSGLLERDLDPFVFPSVTFDDRNAQTQVEVSSTAVRMPATGIQNQETRDDSSDENDVLGGKAQMA